MTAKGTLLAFCEGRRNSRSDAGDIDVLLKRSTDGGRTWSKRDPGRRLRAGHHRQPLPGRRPPHQHHLAALDAQPGRHPKSGFRRAFQARTRTVWVTHSNDDGLTWAAPADITAAVKQPDWTWYATGPVNGIQLRSGRLVIPCDHVRGDLSHRYSHVIYSDDRGNTWKLGGSAGPICNESTVAELSDGSLMLNMRSYAGKNRRMVSISRNGGLTWSEPAIDEALIEPVCQASLIGFGKGKPRVLLFSNPAATGRVNMTVRLSRDEGKTWSASKMVHAGSSAYSNLIELNGKTVGLLYERGDAARYERITFARFPIAWLEGR